METKNLIISLLAGAAVGAVIGLMLSPGSAKVLANKLADGTVGESLKAHFNDGVDKVGKKGKDLIDSTVSRVKA